MFAAIRHLVAIASVPLYTVRDVAPASLREVHQALSETGRLVIWGGASDRTVYGAPALNHRFRAWHDAIHVALQAKFTYQDEVRVAVEQMAQAHRLLRDGTQAALVIRAEVVGQLDYLAVHGTFPADQLSFTVQYLRREAQ